VSKSWPVFLRRAGHRALEAIGVEGAGQQVVDGHALRRDGRARHAGHEAGEAAARAVGEAQDVDRRLHRLEVMFTMRPKPRLAMPSTVALMNSMGVSMLASTALIHASRSQLRKSPGGGPPALVTTMSKSLAQREHGGAAGFGGDVGRHVLDERRAERAPILLPASSQRLPAPRRRAPRSPR
jgi:hypothetical protein